MSARDRIMGDIRGALGRGELSEQAKARLETRLKSGKANLIPARSDKPHAEQVSLFAEMAEGAQASVARVPDGGDVPGAVADYLAQNNLPSDIVMAPDEALDAYPWAESPLLNMQIGRASCRERV